MGIFKNSPNSLDFFKTAAVRSSQLEEYDLVKLQSSRNANRVASSVAGRVIRILDNRPTYAGRAIPHGSFTRGTNLAKPGLSDVDVLCFVRQNRTGSRTIASLNEFDGVRRDAAAEIRDHLLNHLPGVFDRVELKEFWEGLCVTLLLKNDWRARHSWRVDVIIAFEGVNHDGILREMRSLTRTEANHNANALSIPRHEFISGYHEDCPRLR